MAAAGHPRAIFKRAIENGNLPVAEVTARELGRITLAEALELTALVAERDPDRGLRFCVRWLRRLLDEDETITPAQAALAASALAALGGPGHNDAFGILAAVAERATSRRVPRGLAS